MAASKSIRITIKKTQGSTPRDQGAKLWVNEFDIIGSIGGGHMEAQAIDCARTMLQSGKEKSEMRITLGPELGQCCGGVVELDFEADFWPANKQELIVIFGAGHVGSALSRLAQASGFAVELIDNREKIEIENPAEFTHLIQAEARLQSLPKGAHIIILTHDHALDFRLAEAALLRDDLGFVGMIGSKSKAAQFHSQFSALGTRLDRLQSPINKTHNDKRPEVIALDILQAIYEHI